MSVLLMDIIGASLMSQEASNLTFGGFLSILSSVQPDDLLTQNTLPTQSPSKLQLFHKTFLENPRKTSLTSCPLLNRVTLFPKATPSVIPVLASLETLTKRNLQLSVLPRVHPD